MKNKKIDNKVAQKVIDLGKLVLQFARVDRITLHEDGKTLESDTDHTVMLSLIACSIAADYKKELNLGLVAQFALVHDLVEVYAGDTPHLHGTALGKGDKRMLDKDKREKKALKRIKKEFGGTFSWLHTTIEKYEKLNTKEARFIKVLDKAMPKLTHYINGVKVLKKYGYSKEMSKMGFEKQISDISKTYGSDQKEAIEIMKLLAKKALSAF